ncbi:hypothetical protein OQI_36535 [Streptomyces pharetrae CZA14]|uniref:Uncharacterized protein n=1 Tax=Streptomyces pharetrae CZA14 TaxID=1144883 RepID=A0ABX3Y7V5_9ACTN|nr:hypothetical protein OQI_36535 [Streptomyces pharetrae CZA14]
MSDGPSYGCRMNGSNASADVPTQAGALLPLLATDERVVGFFAGVADLDAIRVRLQRSSGW